MNRISSRRWSTCCSARVSRSHHHQRYRGHRCRSPPPPGRRAARRDAARRERLPRCAGPPRGRSRAFTTANRIILVTARNLSSDPEREQLFQDFAARPGPSTSRSTSTIFSCSWRRCCATWTGHLPDEPARRRSAEHGQPPPCRSRRHPSTDGVRHRPRGRGRSVVRGGPTGSVRHPMDPDRTVASPRGRGLTRRHRRGAWPLWLSAGLALGGGRRLEARHGQEQLEQRVLGLDQGALRVRIVIRGRVAAVAMGVEVLSRCAAGPSPRPGDDLAQHRITRGSGHGGPDQLPRPERWSRPSPPRAGSSAPDAPGLIAHQLLHPLSRGGRTPGATTSPRPSSRPQGPTFGGFALPSWHRLSPSAGATWCLSNAGRGGGDRASPTCSPRAGSTSAWSAGMVWLLCVVAGASPRTARIAVLLALPAYRTHVRPAALGLAGGPDGHGLPRGTAHRPRRAAAGRGPDRGSDARPRRSAADARALVPAHRS